MPVDVIDLPVGKQRYGLLLTDEGTIIDDLMFVNRGADTVICSSSSTAPARWATSPTSRPASAPALRRHPHARPRPAGAAGPAGGDALRGWCPAWTSWCS
jgi:glycine cleavage system aminomethyltransferase T